MNRVRITTNEEPPATAREQALSQEVKRQTDQLQAINNVITAASRSEDVQHTLHAALEAALSIIPLEASGISLIDRAAGELVMCAQRGWKYDFTSTPMRIKLGTGLSGQAVMSGEVVISDDVTHDPRLVVPAFAEEQIKAQALVPMRARGSVIGVLSVMSRSPYNFSESEIKTLQVIADQVGLALDNARLYESMRVEQSRLQAVLDSTADAIIATDDAGRINLVNHAAEKLFSLRAEMIMGRPLRESPLLPFDLAQIEAAMRRDESASLQTRMIEARLPNERYLFGFVSPVYSPQHTQTDENPRDAWVAVFQDVTHLKAAELARILFIQMAAHELRTPIAITLSAVNLLRGSIKEPSARDLEIYDIALRGINRMQDLVDDLLDLERLESGVDFRHEPVNVPDLVERCVTDMAPVLERKSQPLQLAVDLSAPAILGDERWLYRALINLLSNAHKYTPSGTLVTVRVGVEGDELLIEVEDGGPGVPLDALPHLFKRFYRAHANDPAVQGTGLGLSIVKSVAERHNGRAYAHSDSRGSLFGVALPVQSRTDESS